MYDKEKSQQLVHQIMSRWIEPELQARLEVNKLPIDFKMYRCLIKLPKSSKPIVQFNYEIDLEVELELSDPKSMKTGDKVYLHQVKEIKSVKLPELNGKPIAFIYLYYRGMASKTEAKYNIVFDFTSNMQSSELLENNNINITLLKALKESYKLIIEENTLLFYDKHHDMLNNNGLWAIPALIPYPLSAIVEKLRSNDSEGARTIIIEHCDRNFLEDLVNKWWKNEVFEQRKNIINDAFSAHKCGKYNLSIYALSPQIEGIITDWEHTQVPQEKIPKGIKSKTKKFRDLVIENPPSTFTQRRIIESTISFMTGKPVLGSFENWLKEIDPAFPNRHAISHGKYEESTFNEENSIKLFLLLDTIYYMINLHESDNDDWSST